MAYDLKQLAQICYSTFASGPGVSYLEYLEDGYEKRAVYSRGQSHDETAYNEGMRYVVREIKDLIRRYIENDYPEDTYSEEEVYE